MLPLYKAVSSLGVLYTIKVTNANIITENDHMSMSVTGHDALVGDPLQHLTSFGENHASSEQDNSLVVQFLVHAWFEVHKAATAKTCNQLRVEVYTGVVCGFDQLPTTSNASKNHIVRQHI